MKTPFLYQARALLIAAILPLVASAASESPSFLLQKGIYAEEIERNLDSAIKIYLQIGAEAATNRSVVAQAQYRLGVCYQKKGNKELAITALNGLLEQFPSETELKQKARDVLSELGQVPDDGLRIHKVPLPQGTVMTVSPDGRFIAYHPPENPRAVAVYESVTGKTWTAVAGTSASGSTAIDSFVFSHDGRRIAYRTSGSRRIQVAGIDGAEPRIIYKDRQIVSLLGWSSDPRKLLVLPWETTPLHVKFMDIETGAQTEITNLPEGLFFDSAVSPDGRFVTTRALGPGAGRGTISMIDVETGRQITRVEKDLVHVVGWSPKHARLLFTSYRSGTVDLWGIEMKDGQLNGAPELVRKNVVDMSFEVADEGKLWCWERKNTADIFVAAADFQTGEVSSEPRRVMDRYSGTETRPIWSKDGNALMLLVNDAPLRFVALSMTSGEKRDYSVARTFDWRIGAYDWAEKDGFIVVQSYTSGTKSGIYRYELAAGKMDPVVFDDSEQRVSHRQPQLSPDSKSIYYIRHISPPSSQVATGEDPKDRIIRKDLRSGKEETIYELAVGPASSSSLKLLKLSPDGTRLALVTWQNSIKVVTPGGGEDKEVVARGAALTNSIAWTPDGKRLVYVKGSDEIWSTAVDSKHSVRLKFSLPLGTVGDLAVHPDGRQVAYRAEGPRENSDLWVMEGFLQKKVAPKKVASVSAATRPTSTEIPLEEILGPNESIYDRKTGVTAMFPEGWTAKFARRLPNQESGWYLHFNVPEGFTDAQSLIRYDVNTDTKPIPADQVDAWLRKWAETTVVAHRPREGGFTDYKNRPASFASRTIGGRPALSWAADFTRDGKKWTEYLTIIYSEKGHVYGRVQARATEIDALRPAYESLVESVRLP